MEITDNDNDKTYGTSDNIFWQTMVNAMIDNADWQKMGNDRKLEMAENGE